jgi:hypothetical protein
MRRHRGLVVGVAALIVIAIAGAAYVFAPRGGNAASPSTTSALSIADLQVEPLTTSGTADRPAISPDGNYVVYVENGGGQQSLRVRQVATGSNVEIVPGEPGVGLMGATATPDGAFVDYVRQAGPQQRPELWQIPFLGGSPRRLIPGIGGRVSFSSMGTRWLSFAHRSRPDGAGRGVQRRQQRACRGSTADAGAVLGRRPEPDYPHSVRSRDLLVTENFPATGADGALDAGQPGARIR